MNFFSVVCNTNILLQQAAGAITHLQAQLADAQAALVTAQAAALPAACSPAARSPATEYPIPRHVKRTRSVGEPRTALEIEQAAELQLLHAVLACGGDVPLPSNPDLLADLPLPPLKAVRLNASEHADMMYRASCARHEWASPPQRRSAGLGERVPPRTR